MRHEATDRTRSRRPTRKNYEPPRVVRVAVDTARLVTGQQFGDTHCTQHYHDSATCPF